jgi:hypothetical protein
LGQDRKGLFDRVEGKRTLADLFEGRSQLIVQHFMFGPRSRGRRSRSSRPTASAWAGHFKFASSLNTDFNCDFNVSFRREDLEKGKVYYNFEMIDAAGAETAFSQRAGEVALAPADPPQRCLRIAADRRLHQLFQRFQQPGLSLGLRLAPAARATNAAGQLGIPAPQLRKTAPDRAARDPRRLRHCRDTAPSRRPRFIRGKQPPRTLVEIGRQPLKARLDGVGSGRGRNDTLSRHDNFHTMEILAGFAIQQSLDKYPPDGKVRPFSAVP